MTTKQMESWRKVWRVSAELLSTPALEALRQALIKDDPKLLQGATTSPPPLQCVQDWPCEGACAWSYGAWKGDGEETVGEVETFFAQMCFDVDQALGEPAGCRRFLNWFDETPRDEMRPKLLAEVNRSLALRGDLLPEDRARIEDDELTDLGDSTEGCR